MAGSHQALIFVVEIGPVERLHVPVELSLLYVLRCSCLRRRRENNSEVKSHAAFHGICTGHHKRRSR